MNKCLSFLFAMVLLVLFTGCACVCPKTEANAVTPPVADAKTSTAIDTAKTSVVAPAMDSAKKEAKTDSVQAASAPVDSSKVVAPIAQAADSLKNATPSTPADTSKQARAEVQKEPTATDSVKAAPVKTAPKPKK